jgi:hypothetical protein
MLPAAWKNTGITPCGGFSSVGRASVCGTECRGFNPHNPPHPNRNAAYDRPASSFHRPSRSISAVKRQCCQCLFIGVYQYDRIVVPVAEGSNPSAHPMQPCWSIGVRGIDGASIRQCGTVSWAVSRPRSIVRAMAYRPAVPPLSTAQGANLAVTATATGPRP